MLSQTEKLHLVTENAKIKPTSFPYTLRSLLTLSLQCFGADRAALLVFNPIAGDRIGYLATENVGAMIVDLATVQYSGNDPIWIENTATHPDFARLSVMGQSLAVLPIGEARYRHALALLYLGYDSAPTNPDPSLVAAVYVMHAHSHLEKAWSNYRHELVLQFSQALYQTTSAPKDLFRQINQEFSRVIDIEHHFAMALVHLDVSRSSYRAGDGQINFDDVPLHPLIEYVVRSKQNVLIRDYHTEFHDMVTKGWIPAEVEHSSTSSSWMISPLRWGDQCIGVLTVIHPHTNHYDQEDMALLELLGNHVEVALRNVNQAESLNAMLNQLRKIDRSIIDVKPLDEILEKVLGAVKGILPHVREAAVVMLDPGTDNLVSRVAFGVNQEKRRNLQICRGDESHVRDVFDDSDPNHQYGLENDVLLARKQGKHFLTISEETVHELDVKIGRHGILNLESDGEAPPFTRDDVEKALLIAGQAEIALQNRDQLERYQKLVELQQEISTMQPLRIEEQCDVRIDEMLYKRLLDAGRKLNWAHYASLFLIDESEHGDNGNFVHMVRFAEDGDERYQDRMTGPMRNPDRLRDDTIRLYEEKPGIVGTQVKEWIALLHDSQYVFNAPDFTPLNIPNVQKDELYKSRYRGYFEGLTHSELVVPIITEEDVRDGHLTVRKGKLIGIINFESFNPNYFTPADVEIARELAQIAVLIRRQTQANYYEMMILALHQIDEAIIANLERDQKRRDDVDKNHVSQASADAEAVSGNGRGIFTALKVAVEQFCADTGKLYVFTRDRRRITEYRHQDSLPRESYYPIKHNDVSFPVPTGNVVIDHLIASHGTLQKFRVFEREKDASLLDASQMDIPESAMATGIIEENGNLIGVLYLESNRKNQFLEDDLSNLEKFAYQIRIAYQMSERIESLQRARRRLTAMREAASALSGAATVDDACQIVFDKAKEMLKRKSRESGRYAVIMRFNDPVEAVMKPRTGAALRYEHNINLGAFEVAVGQGVTGLAVKKEIARLQKLISKPSEPHSPERAPITICIYSVDSVAYQRDIQSVLPHNSAIHSIAAVPICTINHLEQVTIFGALTLISDQYYYFSRGDEEFLRMLATLLVETLRRFETSELNDAAELGALMFDVTHPIISPGSKFKTSWSAVRQQIHSYIDPLNPNEALKRNIEIIDEHRTHWDNVAESIQQIKALSDTAKQSELISVSEMCEKLMGYLRSLSIAKDNPDVKLEPAILSGQANDEIFMQVVWDTFMRAMGNIVKNGIEALRDRHGDDKVITFEFAVSQDERFVVLRVIDNGPGISPALIDVLFEMGKSSKREKGGTGVGLFVVKMLLKMQGIIISARNRREPAQGAVFEIIIPAHSGHAAAGNPTLSDT